MVTDQTPAATERSVVERIGEDGFANPIRLFTRDQCALIVRHFKHDKLRESGEWWKDWAAVDPFYYKIGMRPALLELLTPVLGPNIVLWGCSILERKPGQQHPWHTDIESSWPGGGFASIWIGLENTSRESSLHLIRGSHHYGKTIQQVRHEQGMVRRGEVTDEVVLGWAREIDAGAELVVPDMEDGDGILFDGRLWHGTNNQRREGCRTALLLQYAAGEVPVYRYEAKQVDYPFEFDKVNRPAVVAVQGQADPERNRVVDPPAYKRRNARPLVSEVSPMEVPLPQESGKPWTPHWLFKGPSANIEFMSVHASVLAPGHSPHPPHVHVEEEILVVLGGKGDLLLGDGPDPQKARRVPVEPGSFTYYPAYQFHTIHNSGSGPLTYLMFKWVGVPYETKAALPLQVLHTAGMTPDRRPDRLYTAKNLFRAPTGYLGKLNAHLSLMDPGGGYPAHEDRHDVAILVLSGELVANDTPVGPNTLLYYSGGTPHGLRNAGNRPAKYLVFEFENPSGQIDPARVKVAGLEPAGKKRRRSRIEKLKTRFSKRLRGVAELFSGETRGGKRRG